MTDTRIENTACIQQLERLSEAGLLAEGKVNTVALDAIRRELGDKWVRRREQVWAHLERLVEEDAECNGFCLRLNDVCFLLCLPDLSAPAAQIRCARILKTLLIYFLGSSTHSDINVRSVIAFSGDVLTSDPVKIDQSALEAASTPPKEEVYKPAASQRDGRALTIESSLGGLQVRFETEFVSRVDSKTLVARRIRRAIFDVSHNRPLTPDRIDVLETKALSAIDGITIRYCLRVLGEPAYQTLGLILPLHIQSVWSSKARPIMFQEFLPLELEVRKRVIVELENICDGTPGSRLTEAVSLLRRHVRAVFARLPMSPRASSALKEARIQGTIVELGAEDKEPRTLPSRVLSLGEIARNIAPTVIVGPLPNHGLSDLCTVGGITHYTCASPVEFRYVGAGEPISGDTTRLIQLIYVSRATDAATRPQALLDDIVKQASSRNEALSITGLLFFHDGWFVQVLEGDRRRVSEVTRSILNDSRHHDVQIIKVEARRRRDFEKWAMAGMVLPRTHKLILDRIGHEHRLDLSEIGAAQAFALLKAVSQLIDAEQLAAPQ